MVCAVMQQTITLTILGRDLWWHMASLGHNELSNPFYFSQICINFQVGVMDKSGILHEVVRDL